MKQFIHFSVIAVFLIIITPLIKAQANLNSVKFPGTDWTTTSNPFNTDVFIENQGQFNNWVQTTDIIKYALADDKIFFTQQGLLFRVDKVEASNQTSKNENEKEADKEENPPVVEKYYVQMHWQDCNPNAVMEVSSQADGYYTFGEKGYENVKAKGYKKIVYKNIYPQIDVEYIIPVKGGIEYKLILNPGADISKVRMKYSGDVENIISDDEGNILINTPAGIITDHAPLSYYQENNSNIQSSFEILNNTVSFKLRTPNSELQTIVIDPWTITPTSLTNDNAAYDIAYDYYGNVFVSGGTSPYKLTKYSAIGIPLWTFTNPTGWGSSQGYYSKFCVLPNSGTTLIGEGWNSSGPRVMKIDPSGTLVYTTPNLPGNNEIWIMHHNKCTEQLIGFGGGTAGSNNLYIISDTNLTSSVCSDFNGYGTTDNDISAIAEDYNGDFYALMSSQVAYSNHLLKSLAITNYSPPCAFDINTGYDFYECTNYGIPGFTGNCAAGTVRANALAVNQNYLFSYDGKTLNAWNKTSGAALGSVIVDAGYAGGQYRTHEGIAVDDCNNVYVGGTNKVHVFSFNGSLFTVGTPITANIPNEVYDISLNKMTGTLYASGLSFVSSILASVECTPTYINPCDSLNNIFLVNDMYICSDSVILNAGPYFSDYLWSTGDTTQTTTVTATGMYFITATWNNTDTIIDSVHVTLTQPYLNLNLGNDTLICGSGNVTLDAGSSFSQYSWNTGSTSQTINVNQTGIYNVYATDTANCSYRDTVKIIFNPAQSLNLGNDTALCYYGTYTLDASIAFDSYQWSTGDTTQIISVDSSGTYYVTATNYQCSVTAVDSVDITFHAVPTAYAGVDDTICKGTGITLNATGGSTYAWNPSTGLSCTSCSNPTANPVSTTTYNVTVTNSSGCTASDNVTVNVVTVSASATPASCGINNGTATANPAGGSGSYTYLWNTLPQQITQTATGLAPATYTVTVTDNDLGCTVTTTAIVTNVGSPVISITNKINPNCGTLNGSMTAIVTGGTPPYTYLWGSSPQQTTQTLVNAPSGIFCVTVTDANSCQSVKCDSIVNIPFDTPEICMVTADTATNYIYVVWEKDTSTSGIDRYYIYRESAISGIYNLIGTRYYGFVSTYLDTTANALQQSYRYKISIHDICNMDSPQSTYHQTVHLTVNAGSGGSWNLIWNDYLGFTFSTYNIYRGTNPGNMTLLNSVASTITSYSDLTPPPGTVYYLIEAVRPTSCNPSKSGNSYASTISNVASSLGSGINEISMDDAVQIFPNPANDNLTVVTTSKSEIEILNIQGQLMKSTFAKNISTTIDISAFAQGMYFVKVKTDKGIAMKKFIKE